MNRKSLIGNLFIITILILISFTSVCSKDLEIKENVSSQPNKELKKNHIIYLIWGLITANNIKVKRILLQTIKEINRDGNDTISEIEEIAESCGADISNIFILSSIKTVDETHGGINCIPGQIRVWFFPIFIAKGSYVFYFTDYWGFNWDLQIDGLKVSEKEGHIIGYFGLIEDIPADHGVYPPIFIFDGYGILIFHDLKS